MAIERNAGGSKFIKDAGEYKVKVKALSIAQNKKDKPMLTVTFQTDDERTIAGYFVKDLPFHKHTLKTLKTACGLTPDDSENDLIGKECGILVEPQEPTPDGKVFMSISGYGPAKKIEFTPPKPATDEVPF